MLEFKLPLHSLGGRIICFRAVLTGQALVKLLARRERNFVKSLEPVNVIVAEHSLLLDQLNHLICRVHRKFRIVSWRR